tara:strand:+ start:904 stop:1215 length:312 start_codon:yes stop_codon:yes gene_type:complete
MKEYVDEYRFRDRFLQSSNYKNNFSYEGLTALFEYFEELEDDCDKELEFDMIAICCEYTEYDGIEDFNEQYSHEKDGYTLDDIREETVVIEIPNTERFITGEF